MSRTHDWVLVSWRYSWYSDVMIFYDRKLPNPRQFFTLFWTTHTSTKNQSLFQYAQVRCANKSLLSLIQWHYESLIWNAIKGEIIFR